MSKTAIVTGASRGIGAAVAVRLAQDGFAVTVNYAGNEAEAAELVKKIKAAGGHEIIAQADVSKPADVERQCSSLGSAVPSDHWPTGIRNTLSRFGVSLTPKTTGDPGKPAPHAAGSVSGTKNIRWGCQCPPRSLKYDCFDIM